MKSKFDGLSKQVNNKIVQVVDSTKCVIMKEMAQDVDHKLDATGCQMMANKDHTYERLTAVENNITEVRDTLRDDVTSWQNVTRHHVSQEIRSIEVTNREKLEQMSNELNSLKENLSESPSVACNARSLQTTDEQRIVNPSVCDSANDNCNDINSCNNVIRVQLMVMCVPIIVMIQQSVTVSSIKG
jgi:hypothetical protein